MRTGFWCLTATSTMVRKLSSSLRPIEQLPGLMRYFASACAAFGIFRQQQVAVVVEVANDRVSSSLFSPSFNDVRDGLCGLVIVHGDAHHLGTGRASAAICCTVLSTSAVSVFVIDCTTTGGIGSDVNPSDIDRYRTTTLYLRHKLSTLKFTIRLARGIAIH